MRLHLMLTDSHAHLDFPDFESDFDAMLDRAAVAGIHRIITIGTTVEGSERAIRLAERYPHVYAVVGVHPNAAMKAPPDAIARLRDLAAHPKVVAIGETGIDYFRLPKASESELAEIKACQASLFEQQLALAVDLGLNAVIHQRASWEDTVAILERFTGKLRAVFHCFGEPFARAEKLLALGHLISFTGIVTFKSATDAQASAARVPAGSYMVETDCPYLAPEPHRGSRCEPAHTRITAEKVAVLRGIPLEQVAAETEKTAEEFFRFQRS